MTSVMWFRRDLRLAAQPALAAAAAQGPVVALYVLDPALLGRSGEPRRRFLGRSLEDLRAATGGRLVVRVGDPRSVVPAVAVEVGATTVWCARDYTPYGTRRDVAVSERLGAAGRQLRGVGSPYLAAPGSVRKPDGTGYAVFSAYWRAWETAVAAAPAWPLSEPDARFVELASDPDGTSVLGAGDPAGLASWPAAGALPAAGAVAAQRRWDWFRHHVMAGYAEGRDVPADDRTSQLSTYLRWGSVHPSQLAADLDDSPGARAYLRELCWREFYADVLARRPDSAWHNLDRRFDAMQVDTDDRARERFAAWQSGRTGYGLVDAGMRQLAATAWMHNRVRMITASFLVKDLHLPWQWGARHFLDLLVDGDLASNNHGWQWVAGSGTDAAPYHRILSPDRQAERFDGDGRYVQRWLGEPLAERLVDHGAERAEALARRAALARSR
jgi:deoxyribodipyrimidine photo-lyase